METRHKGSKKKCSQNDDCTDCDLQIVKKQVGRENFVCHFCLRVFRFQSSFIRHLKVVHEKNRDKQCTQCPYRTAEQSKLTIHIRSHTGDSPYKCDVCFKAFKSQTTLNRHGLVHSKMKKWICVVCFVRFGQSASLKLHMFKFHRISKDTLRKRQFQSVEDLPEGMTHNLIQDGFMKDGAQLTHSLKTFEEISKKNSAFNTTDRKRKLPEALSASSLSSCTSKLPTQIPFHISVKRQDDEKEASTVISPKQHPSATAQPEFKGICIPLKQDQTAQQKQLNAVKRGKYGPAPRVIHVKKDGSIEDISSHFTDHLPKP